MRKSRKRDRSYGPLGWWVLPVLIHPTRHGCRSGRRSSASTKGGAVIKPIAPGAAPPPSLSETRMKPEKMQWGANALTAPTTPAKRMPVIDKSKVDPQMLEAAEGMEGMFLDYLMQVMRKTVPKNDFD